MAIRIYDGNNYGRIQFERDPTGFAPRNITMAIDRSEHPVIWVWDAIDGSRKRKDIYPGYKKNRGPLDRTIFDGFKTLEVVLQHTKAIQVKVPGFEADDVIATLARHYASKKQVVEIMSNDWDFAQVAADYPKHIFAGYVRKEGVPDHHVKLYKICVGDPADCISGIPGFGKDTWEKMDKKKLGQFIAKVIRTGEVPEQNFLPKRVKINPDYVRQLNDVVSFFDVPMDQINSNMKIGQPNYEAIDQYLKGFFQ